MWGLTVEEASGPPVEVWPETMQAATVFCAMSTQWRFGGMSGVPTGLDYSALSEVWRRTKTPSADRDAVFDDLRVMEEAALQQVQQERKQ